MKITSLPLSALALAVSAAPAAAQLPLGESLSDRDLDALRGGFVSEDGFHVDFSVQNMVLVNGEAVLQSELFAANGQMANLQFTQVGGDGTGMIVASSGLHTIIQNSLDNQAIESLRIMNIQLSNLQDLRSLGLRDRLDDGIIQSLR
jgi:hypothetical protein